MTKMIPPVPTAAVMLQTPKQKIGFSIASIVGNDNTNNTNAAVAAAAAAATVTDTSLTKHTITIDEHQHLHNNNNNINSNSSENASGKSNVPSSPPQTPPGIHTHLPLSLPIPLSLPPPPSSSSMLPHPHHALPSLPTLPSHLTPAQQQALHQHLLLQQSKQFHSPDGSSPPLPMPMRHDIQDILQRLHNSAAIANLSHHHHHHHHHQQQQQQLQNGGYSPTQQQQQHQSQSLSQQQLSPSSPVMSLKRTRSPIPLAMENEMNPPQRHQPPHTPPKSVSPQSSHPSSPPPFLPNSPASSSSSQYLKTGPPGPPLLMPGLPPAGLVRPFPVGPGGPLPLQLPPPPPQAQPPQQGMPDIKALPPYINTPPDLPPQHNPHLIAAAQFQMAAAIQAGHVLGPAAAAAAAAGLPPHAAPFMTNPAGMPRDTYPLYPWLLSRHGRIFPHRFPGNFLLQPFRKPKRIRTAFSPSQLLKLEHAFESNQYVVGAERKALAQSLNLSETQVKVWFQNRRTKHKRMQQEDEKGEKGEKSDRHASDEDDDDELIDLEMEDCTSDDEHEHDSMH